MARTHKSPKLQKQLRNARTTGKWPSNLIDPLWTQHPHRWKGSGTEGRNRDSAKLKK